MSGLVRAGRLSNVDDGSRRAQDRTDESIANAVKRDSADIRYGKGRTRVRVRVRPFVPAELGRRTWQETIVLPKNGVDKRAIRPYLARHEKDGRSWDGCADAGRGRRIRQP